MNTLKAEIVLGNELNIKKRLLSDAFSAFNKEGLTIFPGFCDVHVHFREPGFSYKETIKSGSLAAARGGFTSVMTMPNLNPVPDSEENLKLQQDIIDKTAVINVYPYASITLGEKGETLVDIKALSSKVKAFSDDGRGVQNSKMMEEAMLLAKESGSIIAAHCEDNSLLFGGYIHKGEYAERNGHKGICSESEYAQIARDLELAKKIGVKYHVCHVSAKESVEIIRQAKKDGVDVTCETAPHYLILTDSDLKEDGKFKMNPPLRSQKDKEALIEGVIDGAIDMLATDHAPHSLEEKSKGLEKSLFGVVGLETAFASVYTNLVKTKIITLEKFIELMSINPKKRFNINDDGFTVFDLNAEYTVEPSKFTTMGRATPFDGMKFTGECLLTVLNGKEVYKKI